MGFCKCSLLDFLRGVYCLEEASHDVSIQDGLQQLNNDTIFGTRFTIAKLVYVFSSILYVN